MAGPRDVPLDQNRAAPWQSPSVHQDVVVLNDFSGVRFEERTRATKGGASVRYSLGIRAEPILHNLRGIDLGKRPAEAILVMIMRQHAAITQPAAPATVLKRKQAVSALARGEPWATRRYSGGRSGTSRPGSGGTSGKGDRYGIDSGRLLDGWFVRQNPAEGTWTVNVPANRLDPSTFGGGLAAVQAFVARLVQLIPALRGEGILEDAAFVRAVGESSPVKLLTMTWFDKAAKYGGVAMKVASEARRLLALAG